jgi:hypothetical protein
MNLKRERGGTWQVGVVARQEGTNPYIVHTSESDNAMNSQQQSAMPAQLIRKAIARRVDDLHDANHIATSICNVLDLLQAELSPVVGSHAALALYVRAIHRTRSTVGWRVPVASMPTSTHWTGLHADLATRQPDDAYAAGVTLLSALVDHLTSLIGLPLTQRIVRSALRDAATDSPSQEPL